MNLRVRNLNRKRLAFTLIDVMVGMGVLGVVLVSLFACFTFGFSVIKISREDLQATQLLQEKMEVIRLYKWEHFTNTAHIPRKFFIPTNGVPLFSGQIDIVPAHSDNLSRVTISLSWTNNKTKITRTNTTFVSRYGLQTYTLK